MTYRRQSMIATLLLSSVLAGCPTPYETPEPNSVGGVARDAQGRPIADARIWLLRSTVKVAEARTGADGRYRVSGLMDVPYQVKAWIEREYEGQRYCLRLGMPHPGDYADFSPARGVVRDFRWQLSGVIEDLSDQNGYFGGEVRVFQLGNFRNGRIEFTLTPTAPLIDGSSGSVVTRVLEADRVLIYDIPLGSYSVTAVLVEPDGTRTPVKFGSDYSDANPGERGTLRFQPSGSGCSNGSGIDRGFLYVHSVYP